eukprot:7353335-Prymnesium_polylepis.2
MRGRVPQSWRAPACEAPPPGAARRPQLPSHRHGWPARRQMIRRPIYASASRPRRSSRGASGHLPCSRERPADAQAERRTRQGRPGGGVARSPRPLAAPPTWPSPTAKAHPLGRVAAASRGPPCSAHSERLAAARIRADASASGR